MRPKQWTKNGFIFIPLLFDGQVLVVESLLRTTAGFALLCLVSSTVYIVNDLVDIEADREHPTKRYRALPSGQLSVPVAIAAAIILPVAALPLAFLLTWELAAVLAGYLALQIAYSFYLKHVVLIDVMSIAAGFVLRVAAGETVIEVTRFSPWLYVFTTMLALFLGFSKRRQELVLLEENAGKSRKSLEQYNLKLLDEMIIIVIAMTVLTYTLYTFSAAGPGQNPMMLLTAPFVLYGIFRYLWLIHVQGETAAPDEVLLQDRPIQAALVLFFATVFVILYVLS
ncbi:MAG: decaprenyl-phosphate phosphoribosyltransferase [Chloroflexi bacterium]|nr:decaprenyl-phosphate phosphoribosyltransferase [Chloroflexota bacterium]